MSQKSQKLETRKEFERKTQSLIRYDRCLINQILTIKFFNTFIKLKQSLNPEYLLLLLVTSFIISTYQDIIFNS